MAKKKGFIPPEGWAQLTTVDWALLPPKIQDMIRKHDLNRSGYGALIQEACFMKGSFDNPEIVVLTMDDGGYYKVHAEYISFYLVNGEMKYSHCSWSADFLYKLLESYIVKGTYLQDPNYHT